MLPSRQYPSCRDPLPVNLDQAPVNYQLMSAQNEITTIVERLSTMEDSFRQQNLNMENTTQGKVKGAMIRERERFKQRINGLMAEIDRLQGLKDSKRLKQI